MPQLAGFETFSAFWKQGSRHCTVFFCRTLDIAILIYVYDILCFQWEDFRDPWSLKKEFKYVLKGVVENKKHNLKHRTSVIAQCVLQQVCQPRVEHP